MVNIDGTDITGATIDGTDVQEITVDGTTVWTAGVQIESYPLFDGADSYNVYRGSVTVDEQNKTVSGIRTDGAGPDDSIEFLYPNGFTEEFEISYDSVIDNASSSLDDRMHGIVSTRGPNGNFLFEVGIIASYDPVKIYDALSTNSGYLNQRSETFNTSIETQNLSTINVSWNGSAWVVDLNDGAYTHTMQGMNEPIHTVRFGASSSSNRYMSGVNEFNFTEVPDTKTVDPNFIEEFEGDLNSRWNRNDLAITTNRAFNGVYSGYCDTAQNGQPQASIVPEGYSNGLQPKGFSFYYQETNNSYGGGIRLVNSNGDVELGLGTDNPETIIDHSGGIDKINPVDKYDTWVKVTATFDWPNNQFDFAFDEVGANNSYSGTRDMKSGVDIKTIQIDDYGYGSWQDGGSIDMWFDDISFSY